MQLFMQLKCSCYKVNNPTPIPRCGGFTHTNKQASGTSWAFYSSALFCNSVSGDSIRYRLGVESCMMTHLSPNPRCQVQVQAINCVSDQTDVDLRFQQSPLWVQLIF